MAACQACKAPILWVKTEGDRMMPLDPEPNDEGNIIILAGVRAQSHIGEVPVVRVFPDAQPTLGEEELSIDGRRYMTHFATCPRADRFRRPTTRSRR